MTSAAWAQAIGVTVGEDGLPAQGSVAGHVRAAAATESFLLRSRIIRALKESYGPFRCEPDALRDVIVATLDALVRIGDLTEFQTDGGPGFVATPERLVDLGDGDVALLGASAIQMEPSTDLVRRLPLEVVRAQTAAPLMGLADEIGLPGWRLHLMASGGLDAPGMGPATLFHHLAGLARSGERIERLGSSDVRVLSKRGDFFGRGQADHLEGRWAEWTGADAYCAVRSRPYGWQHCILTATPAGSRVLDITDHDRWRWAAIGQTRALGDRVGDWTNGVYQALTPPPVQLQQLLALTGRPDGPWRWRVAEPSAQLAARLVGQPSY